MKPLEVRGEIKHINDYEKYETLRKNTDSLKKAVTLTALRRVISFNEEGITGDKFVIIKKVEDFDQNIEREVLAHPN